MNKHTPMDADVVRAMVAQKYPEALRSPFAQFVREVTAHDETQRVIGSAGLQATGTAAATRRAAAEHARQCIDACQAAGIEYDDETLGHNIESSFPELDADECDEIARAAGKGLPQYCKCSSCATRGDLGKLVLPK